MTTLDAHSTGTEAESATAIFSRQVRIDQLSSLYGHLGQALIQAGVAPQTSIQLLETCISVHCCQCGIPISGDELALAAVSDSPRQAAKAKIQRLIAGYCGRNGCNSYYCELRFSAISGIDWQATWEAVQVIAGGMSAAESTPLPARLRH